MGRDWHPFIKSRKKVDEKRFSRLMQGRKETAQLDHKHAPRNISNQQTQRNNLRKLLEEALRKAGKERIDCGVEDLTDLSSAVSVQDTQLVKCEENSRVIIKRFTAEVMRHLKNNPSDVKRMTGHAFEDLLAEILASLGFEDLSLRVQTVAGEVDILGFSEDRLGSRIGYIFELKQFGLSERPVSLDAITRLNGLRDGLKNKLGITEGVFVTTTHYTQPSKQAAAFHQIALKQYEHLVEWLRQYEFGTNGLFLQSIGE